MLTCLSMPLQLWLRMLRAIIRVLVVVIRNGVLVLSVCLVSVVDTLLMESMVMEKLNMPSALYGTCVLGWLEPLGTATVREYVVRVPW